MAIRPERAASWLPVVWPAAAIVVTALALGGVSAGLGNPDQLVTSSFVTALETQTAAADRSAGTPERSGLVQLSGSEEFWLDARNGTPNAVPVVLNETLRLGDRVTFGSGADERRFEVVDIRSLGDAGAAHSSGPLMLITCRDASTPDAPQMRFVIERADPGAVRRTPHAL